MNTEGATSMRPEFIPSSSWAGSREGYYFRRGSQGTGYYLDKNKSKIQGEDSRAKQNELDGRSEPPIKKARFDTSQNQTMTIPNRIPDGTEPQASVISGTTQPIKGVVMDLSPKGLRTATSLLAKCITRNELQRAQALEDHGNDADGDGVDPTKFMASEVALYEHFATLKSIAAAASELYGILAAPPSNGKSASSSAEDEPDLLTLLTQLIVQHPNADIGASVVSVLLEWLDPNLLDDGDSGTIVSITFLARRILLETTEALIENLERFTPASVAGSTSRQDGAADSAEDEDEVGRGAEDILSLLENLLEIENVVNATPHDGSWSVAPAGDTVALFLCRQTKLVSWLFLQVEDANLHDGELSSLRVRSMELLANLAPREELYTVLSDWSRITLFGAHVVEDDEVESDKKITEADDTKKPTNLDGIEILLQVVAAYKKTQPTNETQLEFLENACIAMASALTYSSLNVQAFLDCQGTELVVRCLRERVHAGGATLKWLDFSTGDEPVRRRACERVVEAGALKYLFPILVERSLPRPALATTKKDRREWRESLETSCIRILYGLTQRLREDSPYDAKARLLAKFSDDDKCDRLVELCMAYDAKSRAAEYRFFKSEAEEALEDEQAVQLAALDAKLEGGGDVCHRLAAIIGFCCVNSRQCHERILSQLHLHQTGMGLIGDALEEFISVLDDGEQKHQLQTYLKEIL